MIYLPVSHLNGPLPELPEQARVHSVFASGFNLELPDGLLAWVGPATGAHYPASFSIALPLTQWRAANLPGLLNSGDSVHIASHADVLRRDQLGLLVSADTQRVDTLLATGGTFTHPGYSDEIAAAIAAQEPSLPDSYAEVSERIAHCLREALTPLLHGKDVPTHQTSALLREVIGLGFGLTPSGDDSVLGALAFTRRYAAPAFASLATALTPLLTRTTDVSANYLRLACAGHFSSHLSGTLRGYAGAPVPGALAGLLSLGHSSGADTARGVLLAAKSFNQE
ncbi:oxamate carbamoyltransferase subunit AllH family protein [Dermabacteraceae bacterium P13128]